MISDFFKNLVEVKEFGWNTLILSSTMTVIFTILQAWGLLKQGKTIQEKKSGKSVSIPTMLYGASYFFAFFFYGFAERSIAMMLNGLLALAYLPILRGLLKFKGFTKKDWALAGSFFAFVPAMILAPFKNELLLAGLVGVLLSQIPQIRELYKTKKPGAIEPKFLAVFMATNVFWFIYAVTIDNWVIKTFNPISFTLLTIMMALWVRYKKIEQAP